MFQKMAMRAPRAALALSMALMLFVVPAGGAFAAQAVVGPNAPEALAASGCTITPVTVVWPQVVTAKAMWGPSCSTGYPNTLSIWEQTSPGNWLHVYGESMPNVSTTGGGYYDLLHGWYCGGIGLWRTYAYIGGQYAWSSSVYCPS